MFKHIQIEKSIGNGHVLSYEWLLYGAIFMCLVTIAILCGNCKSVNCKRLYNVVSVIWGYKCI